METKTVYYNSITGTQYSESSRETLAREAAEAVFVKTAAHVGVTAVKSPEWFSRASTEEQQANELLVGSVLYSAMFEAPVGERTCRLTHVRPVGSVDDEQVREYADSILFPAAPADADYE